MMLRIIRTAVKHGREALENILEKAETYVPKKKTGVTICRKVEKEQQNYGQWATLAQRESKELGKSGTALGRFLARNATKTLASELRQRFALNTSAGSYSLYGVIRGGSQHTARLSRLAFVGLCLTGCSPQAQWQAQQQRDLYGSVSDDGSVCDYIKTLFKDQGGTESNKDSCYFGQNVRETISEYSFGDIIAKGSSAVVYEATNADIKVLEAVKTSIEASSEVCETSLTDTSFELISEENSEVSSLNSSVEIIETSSGTSNTSQHYTDPPFSPTVSLTGGMNELNQLEQVTQGEFDLAIKMMFNYDIESKATSLFRQMYKELVPLDVVQEDENIWHNWNHVKKKKLPPHPNIVVMKDAFADDMPALSSSMEEYPDALPKRLYKLGYGRNKTLFIVMKKYDCTVEEYIHQQVPSVKESCVLITQLMEAALHINQHKIAHRDLKTNNLLLDQSVTSDWPRLVVSDFGCCTTEGLSIPFQTEEVDRGGNPLLMAPEIARAQPGLFSFLDYSKADLWAIGAIAFEVFGGENPFYPDVNGQFILDTQTYDTGNIPDLPNHVPSYINHMVHLMLQTDPSKRPEAMVMADMLHFVLWCPDEWKKNLVAGSARPSHLDLRRWLLLLSAETILQKRLQVNHSKVEQTLKEQFLSRVDFVRLCEAVELLWLWKKN